MRVISRIYTIFLHYILKLCVSQDIILINFRHRSTDTSITVTALMTLTIVRRSAASSLSNAATDTFSRVTNDLFVYRTPDGPLYLPANVRFFSLSCLRKFSDI